MTTLRLTPHRALLAAALLPALLLAACGGPSERDVTVAGNAAGECADRLGATVTAVAPTGLVAAEEKPNTAAPIVGVAGAPPMALGYRSDDGNTVVFGVAPESVGFDLYTPYATAENQEGMNWFKVSSDDVIAARRCLGGSGG